MQEAILEPSRKLQGMQTIIVHEVLLGLESAGGLWHMGEEMGGEMPGLGLWVWAQWRHCSAPCSPIPPSTSICTILGTK